MLRRIVSKNEKISNNSIGKGVTSFEGFKIGNKEIIVSDKIIIKDECQVMELFI
ncbi:hypothetical protein [Romboutsia lituseburensis]|uniref:hypothetical protein n=1 Tax=Romboutsia lituseburensis TaxID=1537 RepID=UPI00215B340D|nr:hypothetical protein [Romboutsia lituseburensis]MCR8743906.1 hypothetical protein [Romboutsia lituseburensis]